MIDDIRVLAVGDEAAVAQHLQRSLGGGAGDIDVVGVRDREAAHQRVAAADCVVVGDGPGTDPVDVVAAIHERRPELPVLLFADAVGDGVATAAFEAGATDVLHRGTGPDATAILERRIRAAVDLRRERRRRSELAERYHDLVETAPVPVAIHVDGEFRSVNPATAAFLGADDPDDLIGREVTSFVHPEDRDFAREHLERTVEEGRSEPVTERLVGLDGEVRHVVIAAARVTYDGDPAVQVVGQDVTELETRRRELEAERDRFSALFENVPNPAVDVRYEDGEPVITNVNEAFESVFGYERGAAVDRPLDELIVAPDRAEEAATLNERFLAGESVHAEVTRKGADGPREFLLSLVPHETGGDATRGFAIYTDVTERRTRERKLAVLHEATRELIDAETIAEVADEATAAAREALEIPYSGVFLSDGEDALRPVVVSPAAQEAFGDVEPLRADESLAWEVYGSGDALVVDDVRDLSGVESSSGNLRSELIVPLGEHGVFRAASPAVGEFSEADRSLASVLAANLEVALTSAQRKTALRERRRQVERQNERLEEFANVVSHDLRNPLEQGRGYLELARSADDPDPDHLEAVDEALVRIDDIISDVLTMARQGGEVEDTEPVDLELLARECWNLVSTTDITLDVVDPPRIRASEGGVRQLIENVFRNTVDHAAGASRIRVGAMDDAEGFYVEDDGPGIPPGVRDRAFDADYSGGGGTGFGLAIVAEVAEAHGWSVGITEAPGGGARFEVTGVETA